MIRGSFVRRVGSCCLEATGRLLCDQIRQTLQAYIPSLDTSGFLPLVEIEPKTKKTLGIEQHN